MVNIFVEMFKMEIVAKKGTSCRRLDFIDYTSDILLYCKPVRLALE